MGRDKLVPPLEILASNSAGIEFDARNASMRRQQECIYLGDMKTFKFRFIALPTAVAEDARKGASENRPDHRLVTVDAAYTAPCRHCLQWAKPGERVILFPYNAVPVGRPYSETGPIFVHAESCPRYEEQAYPSEFREGRVFRAYNSEQDMIDAQPADGEEPEAVIERLFENPDTAFVHARSASRGCYTFGVERS